MTNRRTEEYQRRLEARGAQWSQLTPESKLTPTIARFGPLAFEHQAVRQGQLAIADRSERELMVLSGDDVVTWLQGLVTNDVFALSREGQGQRTHVVNHVGRTITDGCLLHIPELLLWSGEPGTVQAELIGHLRRHIIMEKVALSDRSEATARLALFGQEASELLAQLGELSHDPRTISGHDGTWGQLLGHDVIVQHTPWTGQWGAELIMDREAAHEVWDGLMAAAPGLIPIGEEALELLRLEAGYVRFGVEYDVKVIPIEADLNATISYDKGCYLGQEVIHRLDTRGRPSRMLRQIVPVDQGQWLEVGQAISVEGKKVGELSLVFDSPVVGKRLGVAMIKRGAYDLGADVSLEGGQAKVEAVGWALRAQ